MAMTTPPSPEEQAEREAAEKRISDLLDEALARRGITDASQYLIDRCSCNAEREAGPTPERVGRMAPAA